MASDALTIHPKKGEAVDLVAPLKAYVEANYAGRDAADAVEDLREIAGLRGDVVAAALASPDARRDLLLRYYRALLLLEARFPIGRAKGGVAKLNFSWADSFRTTRKHSAPDVQFEKAAVLFNVAVSYCATAGGAERGSAEGLRAACAAWQAAAGAFEACGEVARKQVAPATVDLSAEAAAALGAMCLAQAQECVYETAVAGGKSGALCCKLAAAAAAFWERAAKALAAPPLRDAVDRAMGAAAGLRGALAAACAATHAADAAAAEDDKATEAARLQGALAALRRETRSARSLLPAAALAPAAALEAPLAARADRAERDATTVYLVRVPPHEQLPALPGTPAVKPTPLAPLLDASKEQLLRTIVPDGAAKYTEAVDGIIREAAAALGDASDAARLRLRELELPELLDALAGGALPAPLLTDLADVARAGGAAAVAQLLPRLGDASRACAAALATARASLAADAGGNPALTAGLRAKIEGYEASLAAAANSDAALAARCAAMEPRVATLNPAEAAAAAPRLTPPPSPSAADAATAPALRATLAELEANAAERAGLEDALKEMKRDDDILPRLMAASVESADAIFEDELKKYDAPRAAVAANVAACEALLGRLGAQHAAFCGVYDVAGYKGRMGAYCADLREALRSYRELQRAAAEGTAFYGQLRAAAAAVAGEAGDWAAARAAEAEEAAAEAARREALAAQARADGERAAALAAAEAAERARAEAAWAQQAQANAHAQAMAHAQAQQAAAQAAAQQAAAQQAAAQQAAAAQAAAAAAAAAQMQRMAVAPPPPPSYPPQTAPPAYAYPQPPMMPQPMAPPSSPGVYYSQPPPVNAYGYAQAAPQVPPPQYAQPPPMGGWPAPPQQGYPRQ